MLQNPCKTLGFKKNMVYKIPPGGGGKPYPASGLQINGHRFSAENNVFVILEIHFSEKGQCSIFLDVLKNIFGDNFRCS